MQCREKKKKTVWESEIYREQIRNMQNAWGWLMKISIHLEGVFLLVVPKMLEYGILLKYRTGPPQKISKLIFG